MMQTCRDDGGAYDDDDDIGIGLLYLFSLFVCSVSFGGENEWAKFLLSNFNTSIMACQNYTLSLMGLCQ